VLTCKRCGNQFKPEWKEGYCGTCRFLYGVEMKFEDTGFPIKGRDTITERLREGFELLRSGYDEKVEREMC
jgi:hypothetical protein